MKTALICAVSALAFLLAPVAQAGTIDYIGPNTMPGSSMTGWMGSGVWFAGVSESNDDTVERFGAPTTVTGNSIDFDPQNFGAQSSNGDGGALVDSQINLMVVALPGNSIETLRFEERGDVRLLGSPTARFAFAQVAFDLFLEVVEVDGAPITPVDIPAIPMVFTPSAGDYLLDVDGGPTAFSYVDDWSGVAEADIDQALLDAGIDFQFGATKVNVTFDNTLLANSEPGTSAFIRKKDADGITITAIIPEPATLSLLALGIVALARRRG